MGARLHAYGVGTFSSSASDDRITYEVPLPQGDATTVDRAARGARDDGRVLDRAAGRGPGGRGRPRDRSAARHGGCRHRRADRRRPERDAHARPDVRRHGGRRPSPTPPGRTWASTSRSRSTGSRSPSPIINERDPRRAHPAQLRDRRHDAGAARADPAIGPAAAAGGGGHALRRATSLGWCPATGSATTLGPDAGSAAAGCQCGRRVGRHERRHPRDQPADPQALERPERVERHPLEPDRRPEADRVGARPDVLAAVVEVADPAVGDDRQPDARVAQLRDDPQADRLDRRARRPRRSGS